jgi:arginyl-tRNA synthetase
MERDPIKHLYNVYVQVNKDLTAEKEAAAAQNPEVKEQLAQSSAPAEGGVPTEEPDVDVGIDAEARAYFKRMESGDESSLVNWKKWRAYSIEQYEKQYATLNVHFDEYLGESMVSNERQIEAVKKLEEMGLVSDAKGAKLIDLEQWKLGKAIVLKRGQFERASYF